MAALAAVLALVSGPLPLLVAAQSPTPSPSRTPFPSPSPSPSPTAPPTAITPPPVPSHLQGADSNFAAVQRVYAASTDPTTKLVFGRKSELWLVVDVDDPPGIDEGEFSCQASELHTCSVDEAAMLAQPGCAPYIMITAPDADATLRVDFVPRKDTPWATHHTTSRLYFLRKVLDTDPVLTPLRASLVYLRNCNYATTLHGDFEYVSLDNTTHAPNGYFAIEPDPSNPLNLDTFVDSTKPIMLDPELEPVSLSLIGTEASSTLSVNDVMWIAITFDGVIDDPLPPNCTIAVNLNVRTLDPWQTLSRDDALAALGGTGHAVITDHMLVYRHKILKGENSKAIAVRSPASQGIIVSNECFVKGGMQFKSTKSGAKRAVSLAGLNFYPCKPSSTDPSGCVPGSTSIVVDTLPPRMVGVSTRKDPSSVFFSGDTIDIAVSFSKPVIFVVTADNNPLAVGRPYLDLNSGGEASFVGYVPNDNSTLLFRYIVGSGESTDGAPLEVTKFVLNGGLVTSANGLDVEADAAALRAVVDSANGLSASNLVIQRSSAARKLEVFGAVGGGRDVFTVHAVMYILLSFDDAVFRTGRGANNTAAIAACRPTLATSVGTFDFVSRDTFNALVQGNVATSRQIVFRRAVLPEDGLVESIEIEKPYDLAVNTSGCNAAATGMVIPVALSKIIGFYPMQDAHNPFEAWVKIDTFAASVVSVAARVGNITAGLGANQPSDIDILVTFSKPVDFQLLLDATVLSDPKKTREARLYGTPRIALNTLAYAYMLGYANPDTKTTLVFRYSVQVGQGTPAGAFLDVLDADAFDAYGGILRTSGNALDVNVALPRPGSTNSLSASRVVVQKTGNPPLPFGYDASQRPTRGAVKLVVSNATRGSQSRRRVLQAELDVAPAPVPVQVTVQINSVIDLSTTNQAMKVDLTLLQEWDDSRFNDPGLSSVSENDTSVLASVWSPRLTFVNLQSKPEAFDGKLLIFNNGSVKLYQRYIQEFAVDINVKDFPFDFQMLSIQLRSNSFAATQLTFVPISGYRLDAQEANMRSIVDPSWTYDAYSQDVAPTDGGLNAGYDVLTTTFRARRIRTYNVVNLLIPLLLICTSVIFTFFMPVESENRAVACETALLGTLGFSFVLADLSPPVSYMTKMGAFTFQAYAFSIVGLGTHVIFGHLVMVVNQLRRMDDGAKGDARERIYEHLYDAVLKYKGAQAPPKPAAEEPAAEARPHIQMMKPMAGTGRVPVAATAGAFPGRTPAPDLLGSGAHSPTAVAGRAEEEEEGDVENASIKTHRTPGTGTTALTRFLARSGSMQLRKIAAAPVAPSPQPGDLVFKNGLLTTRATEEEARRAPPPEPDPKVLAGFFVPPVLPRKYHVFDLYGVRFGELHLENREVYIERLRKVNAWVRLAFIVAFVVSTACIFTVAP